MFKWFRGLNALFKNIKGVLFLIEEVLLNIIGFKVLNDILDWFFYIFEFNSKVKILITLVFITFNKLTKYLKISK